MPAVVLVGHDHDCPMCGPTTINSGTRNVTVNGRAVALVGDAFGCGAVITSGSPSMNINGKAVARVGDTSDHDGVLENGDAKGIKSNTVGGKCYPLEKSSTVRAEGKLVVRHDDKFWMNGA